MKPPGSSLAGRYAGALSRDHIRILSRLERSGMCTREEAVSGCILPPEFAVTALAQLERYYLLQESGGWLRITTEGSSLLTTLGLGAGSFRAYIPPGSLPEPERQWLEAMALQYRDNYHTAWLNTLQCLKFWRWIRRPRSRKKRRKQQPVNQYIAILLHDLLFHPLPPVFPPGFADAGSSPSFLKTWLAARDRQPAPRYSLSEYLRLKDLFFRHERYSMMYLLEARHYRAPHFRLNMRNIYRYFLLETRPHRKTAVPAPPPPGAIPLPVLSAAAAAEDLRNIPQEYWPLQIPCALKHFHRSESHERFSQVIRAAPFTIRLHDVVTHGPVQLSHKEPKEPCCSLQVLQRVMPCETTEKTAFFGCGALRDPDPAATFHELPADAYFCAFRADIRPEDLVRLSATWPLLSALAGKAAAWLHGAQPAVSLHNNELMNMLIGQILHCTYIGDVAQSFLRRICIDLLLAVATQNSMDTGKRRVRLTQADKLTLRQIFTRARQDVGLLTDTQMLTEHFRISRYKYQNGFLQEFGISPGDYHQMLIMYHAFHLLHRSGKSMLITAIRCGFETPGDLRSAFIRHFGTDPCHLSHMQ